MRLCGRLSRKRLLKVLENDGADLVGELLEAVLDTFKIVEGSDGDIVDAGFGHAEAAGDCIGCLDVSDLGELRLHTDESSVM